MGLLYPCFATRAEIAAATRQAKPHPDPDGAPIYPGLWRNSTETEISAHVSAGKPFALRLDMAKALKTAAAKQATGRIAMTQFTIDGSAHETTLNPARWGDVVIARKDTGTSYHLAGVIDDAAQKVSHVCRGKDLEAATDIHRLLQILLDLPEPVYHHHDLVYDGHGQKLSKSSGSTALHKLRQDGWTAAGIRKKLDGFLQAYHFSS